MSATGFGGAVGAAASGGLAACLRSLLATKRPDLKAYRFADFQQPPGAAATSAGPMAGAFGEVKIYKLRSSGALVAVKELRVDSLDPDSMRKCPRVLRVSVC